MEKRWLVRGGCRSRNKSAIERIRLYLPWKGGGAVSVFRKLKIEKREEGERRRRRPKVKAEEEITTRGGGVGGGYTDGNSERVVLVSIGGHRGERIWDKYESSLSLFPQRRE